MSDTRRHPRRENVTGDFFVDHTCIDCDTCRWMSPSVFSRAGEKSAVTKQPETEEERHASMQALLSCPTSSIHVNKVQQGELKETQESFPIPLLHSEELFYCGFMDEKTFAASSYFIRSPKGNVMMDCPRFNAALVKQFDKLGGVQFIVLSHIDDVGDHAKWARHYNATRIIHKKEINYDTRDCEIQLEGTGPWTVGGDGDMEEMEIIHTPGHTAGSICLFHKASKSMFTGDHLGYSERMHALSIFPRYNWHSVRRQYESVKKLMEHDFLRVYPGHGRRIEFVDRQHRDEQICAMLNAQDC